MACHHRLWAAHTVERHRAWHEIKAFGKHTRSNDVGRGMPSTPLGSIYDRMTSGKACHQGPWKAHTVERRRVWHDITALGQHTRSSTSGMTWHHRPWTGHTVRNVRRGMTSPPLDNTHGRTTSGVACHHRHWLAHTVERHCAMHSIIAFGWQTRSNDIRRGMPSSPLGSTNGRTMSGVACYHSP